MEVADEVVLVVTHETFEAPAPALVGPLDRVTGMVCDRRPSVGLDAALGRAGVVHSVAGC